MNKSIRNNDAYYQIAWSKIYKYDKYDVIKIVPELAGIVCLGSKTQSNFNYLLFYACWRDGCRVSIKKLVDPRITINPELTSQLDTENLYYKYTIIDSNPKDIKDVMFWLIKTYSPEMNNATSFTDSKRYDNIFVKESQMKSNEIIAKFPGSRP